MKRIKLFEEFLNEETQFPAQFEIDEPVSFKTSEEDEERWGSVVKVSFIKAKVFYDILDDYTSTVIEFVDSSFVKTLKSDIKLEEPKNEAKSGKTDIIMNFIKTYAEDDDLELLDFESEVHDIQKMVKLGKDSFVKKIEFGYHKANKEDIQDFFDSIK